MIVLKGFRIIHRKAQFLGGLLQLKYLHDGGVLCGNFANFIEASFFKGTAFSAY